MNRFTAMRTRMIDALECAEQLDDVTAGSETWRRDSSIPFRFVGS